MYCLHVGMYYIYLCIICTYVSVSTMKDNTSIEILPNIRDWQEFFVEGSEIVKRP